MKTTFSRLFYTTAAVVLTALLVLGTAFQVLVKDYLQTNTTDKLTSDAQTISDLAAAYYSESNLQNPNFLANLTVASRVSQADAVICNARGEVILCSDSPLGCEHQGKVITRQYVRKVMEQGVVIDTGVIQGLYPDSRYVVSVPIRPLGAGVPIGIVIVSASMENTVEVLHKISQIFLFVALLVVLIAMLAVGFFARRQSQPLRQMADAARNFGHGNLTARVKLRNGCTQEMEDLALAFNNMASSLQKSEYQRQEFVANVSHELKTPMTVIGGYVDGIIDGTIPPDKQDKYLHIVSDEVKRFSRLVRSMLDISRLQDEAGIPEEMKSRFDLEECAGQVLITFEQKILSRGINVDVQMPEHPVYTRANQDYITQVIYNLLDNAVKFCPQGGTLGLRIREGGPKAYVSVSNEGDTIPPEELPMVFERFHKLDKSRTQNRDGWGLGLYIVKTIVCSHGENISVTSRDGTTEFTFTLPLVN